ncbi:MAG: protein nirF [Magnetococcales bacterium]|nr:protein nirF [Magnetococcales bacterium]
MRRWLMVGLCWLLTATSGLADLLRGTGDLGIVIERTSGQIQVVDTTAQRSIHTVPGLGDLSHAAAVFSRDGRFAFVFGRDGGLNQVDLLRGVLVKRIVQAGNSIGGAISQDGRLVAVANYEPGGVRVFDSQTLEPIADIPAVSASGQTSRVVGIVDAPGQQFCFSLFDASEIWCADLHQPNQPTVRKFRAGDHPYDGLITPDGRFYLAGLFGEDGLSLLDLWQPQQGVQTILNHYGRGEEKLPVYKMPHLRGWAAAGELLFLPAIGRHELLVVHRRDWREVGRIAVHGQPVFVMARPDGRQVWVNFALPHNDTIQVVDVPSLTVIRTLQPGKGIMHMEFTPKGEHVWLSVRDEQRVDIYDTEQMQQVATLPAQYPSGIFFTARAHRMGF